MIGAGPFHGSPRYQQHLHLLNSALLDCTALQYTALYCNALNCSTIHRRALHCTVLSWTALYCTTQPCTVLHFTALQFTALHCTLLNYSFHLSLKQTVSSPCSLMFHRCLMTLVMWKCEGGKNTAIYSKYYNILNYYNLLKLLQYTQNTTIYSKYYNILKVLQYTQLL